MLQVGLSSHPKTGQGCLSRFPIFPTTVGLTFAQFDPGLYGSVFALIFAMGLLGSSIVPAAIGVVSKRKSIRTGMRILAGVAVVLLLLASRL